MSIYPTSRLESRIKLQGDRFGNQPPRARLCVKQVLPAQLITISLLLFRCSASEGIHPLGTVTRILDLRLKNRSILRVDLREVNSGFFTSYEVVLTSHRRKINIKCVVCRIIILSSFDTIERTAGRLEEQRTVTRADFQLRTISVLQISTISNLPSKDWHVGSRNRSSQSNSMDHHEPTTR